LAQRIAQAIELASRMGLRRVGFNMAFLCQRLIALANRGRRRGKCRFHRQTLRA